MAPAGWASPRRILAAQRADGPKVYHQRPAGAPQRDYGAMPAAMRCSLFRDV